MGVEIEVNANSAATELELEPGLSLAKISFCSHKRWRRWRYILFILPEDNWPEEILSHGNSRLFNQQLENLSHCQKFYGG